jgi:hypothetical protein
MWVALFPTSKGHNISFIDKVFLLRCVFAYCSSKRKVILWLGCYIQDENNKQFVLVVTVF